MSFKINKPSPIVIQIVFINIITLLLALCFIIARIDLQYKENEKKIAVDKHSLIWTALLNESIEVSLGLVRNRYERDISVTNEVYGVRIADSNNTTLFLEYPSVWNKYFYNTLDWNNSTNNTDGVQRLKIIQSNNKRINTNLDVYNLVVNNYYLQIIISTEQRKQFLISTLQNGLPIIVIIMILSIVITNIVITRVLTPLTTINSVIEKIINQQQIHQRLIAKEGGEFERLQNNFNIMLDVIERQVNRLRQAAINLGHDIRTPLTHIRNRLEDMSTSQLSGDNRHKVSACIDTIDNLTILTKKVLDLSEIESGLVNVPKEKISVAHTLENILEMYALLAEEKHIIFSSAIDDSLHLYMDNIRLQQCISNILENAIHHTPANKHIYLLATPYESNPHKVYFEITDEGEGIAQEDIEYIWSPAWSKVSQMEMSTYSRSGFGLAIVESIVKAYQGEIQCESTVGKGTTFKIVI